MTRVLAGTPRSSALWRPLREPIFRNLLAANAVSDVGAFMQAVGAAWLMVSFGAGPMLLALTQTAATLPFFVLALPAGAIGDIVDRRKLILATEVWMIVATGALAALTLVGAMSPWLLLALTFAISAGDAFESPSWRALLPDLVPRDALAAASALNGIEFNLARAVGPALAGVVIAVAGVGVAFALNAASFVGVLIVVARWKRPRHRDAVPVERFGGATIAAVRYVWYSPTVRALILRSGTVMFFASAVLALLPSVARRASPSALGYGYLLGAFGAGAIVGALAMQAARARWSDERIASATVALLGAAIAATSRARAMPALAAVMLAGGGCWIVFISLVSALVQGLAPDWVRARVLAVFMLVFQGGLAAGSAVWGAVAERAGIDRALVWAGIGTFATAVLGRVWGLPSGAADVSPWNHWRMPTLVDDVRPALEDGPVLVTVEYSVRPDRAVEFVAAMHRYERVRRRDGASRWGIYQDTEAADRYVETFVVGSWAEHLRQHARQTQADRALEEQIQACVRGEPSVRHLIYARPFRFAE